MRVYTVQCARKDHKNNDGEVIVPKGSKYYWWQFRNCSKTKSLTYPTGDQLDKYKGTRIYEEWESIQSRVQGSIDSGEFDSELLDELRTFVEQEDEKVDNIPESLEYSDQSEEMRERRDEAQQLLDEYDE